MEAILAKTACLLGRAHPFADLFKKTNLQRINTLCRTIFYMVNHRILQCFLTCWLVAQSHHRKWLVFVSFNSVKHLKSLNHHHFYEIMKMMKQEKYG